VSPITDKNASAVGSKTRRVLRQRSISNIALPVSEDNTPPLLAKIGWDLQQRSISNIALPIIEYNILAMASDNALGP
jgi:dihydroorotate dehydrogenase